MFALLIGARAIYLVLGDFREAVMPDQGTQTEANWLPALQPIIRRCRHGTDLFASVICVTLLNQMPEVPFRRYLYRCWAGYRKPERQREMSWSGSWNNNRSVFTGSFTAADGSVFTGTWTPPQGSASSSPSDHRRPHRCQIMTLTRGLGT
jgi:hypothetical protein